LQAFPGAKKVGPLNKTASSATGTGWLCDFLFRYFYLLP